MVNNNSIKFCSSSKSHRSLSTEDYFKKNDGNNHDSIQNYTENDNIGQQGLGCTASIKTSLKNCLPKSCNYLFTPDGQARLKQILASSLSFILVTIASHSKSLIVEISNIILLFIVIIYTIWVILSLIGKFHYIEDFWKNLQGKVPNLITPRSYHKRIISTYWNILALICHLVIFIEVESFTCGDDSEREKGDLEVFSNITVNHVGSNINKIDDLSLKDLESAENVSPIHNENNFWTTHILFSKIHFHRLSCDHFAEAAWVSLMLSIFVYTIDTFHNFRFIVNDDLVWSSKKSGCFEQDLAYKKDKLYIVVLKFMKYIEFKHGRVSVYILGLIFFTWAFMDIIFYAGHHCFFCLDNAWTIAFILYIILTILIIWYILYTIFSEHPFGKRENTLQAYYHNGRKVRFWMVIMFLGFVAFMLHFLTLCEDDIYLRYGVGQIQGTPQLNLADASFVNQTSILEIKLPEICDVFIPNVIAAITGLISVLLTMQQVIEAMAKQSQESKIIFDIGSPNTSRQTSPERIIVKKASSRTPSLAASRVLLPVLEISSVDSCDRRSGGTLSVSE